MKIKSTQEFFVRQDFAPYLEYGVGPHLSDDELAQADAFLDSLPHPGSLEIDSGADWNICSISRLHDLCFKATWETYEEE